MRRFQPVVVIVAITALLGCSSSAGRHGSGSSGGKYSYGKRENAFFDDFMNDTRTIDLSYRVDFSEVGDRELIAAAKVYCAALKTRTGSGAARFVARRFEGRVSTPTGADDPEGALTLAARLGPFARAHFCPSRAPAPNPSTTSSTYPAGPTTFGDTHQPVTERDRLPVDGAYEFGQEKNSGLYMTDRSVPGCDWTLFSDKAMTVIADHSRPNLPDMMVGIDGWVLRVRGCGSWTRHA